MLPENVAKSIY